jgi:hypothetical protein
VTTEPNYDRTLRVRIRFRARVSLRLAVYRQSFRLGDKPLRLTTSNFIFQLNACDYSSYVTSSLKRARVCRLQLLLVLVSTIVLRSESRGTRDHILLSQIRDSTNLEGQVPVFIHPSNRVTQLYSQALGSLFVISYDSQDYGGGIRPRLNTGFSQLSELPLLSSHYIDSSRTTAQKTYPLSSNGYMRTT